MKLSHDTKQAMRAYCAWELPTAQLRHLIDAP